MDKEAELYGDNISTGQRTDSGLNQSSINNSEENNLESKNNVISQENKEKNKNKKKRKNFVRKSDCLEGESITQQTNSMTFKYYSSSLNYLKEGRKKRRKEGRK